MNFSCKVCDYNTDDKSNYNKHLQSKKHINNIEKITVLVEYQPSFNEKARTIYNQIIYEYSNLSNYKLYIMNPLYKNKIYGKYIEW